MRFSTNVADFIIFSEVPNQTVYSMTLIDLELEEQVLGRVEWGRACLGMSHVPNPRVGAQSPQCFGPYMPHKNKQICCMLTKLGEG